MPAAVSITASLLALAAVAWAWRRRGRLRVAEASADALFETAINMVWTADRRGRWVRISEAAGEILGQAPADLVGTPIEDVVAPDQVDRCRELLARAKAGETVTDATLACVRADGSRVKLRLGLAPLRGAGGRVTGVLGCAADVSLVRDLQRRLLHTERMHAIGAMAGGIAHDFKNLLTVIIAQGQLAQTGSDPERRLLSILDTAERGKDMVQQLLSLSREHSAQREVLDLTAATKELEHVLQRLLPAAVHLRLKLARKPVHVKTDRTHIEQILTNLVANAGDASSADGWVTVSVDGGELPAAKCQELGVEPGRWAVLQVVDKGTGMTEEVLAQAFEPFYTTKGGKGTGLGLSTVHALVHQAGGAVKARSEPGRGTRMAILLPLVTDPATTDTGVGTSGSRGK